LTGLYLLRDSGFMILETRKLSFGALSFDLIIKRNKRAKNVRMRVDNKSAQVFLVLPRWTSVRRGLTFFKQSQDWVAKHLQMLHEALDFEQQGHVDYLGERYNLEHTVSLRARVAANGNTVCVMAPKGGVNQALETWFKAQASIFMAETSHKIAQQLGVTINKISIKDMKSRWGSCSPQGNLAYSWRVMMAPRFVAEYLCVHEVCHRKEMNHSKRFWDLVARFCPDHQVARRWLRTHGKTLF
jgi:predicted metal-dependent hydrolase